MMDMVGMTGIDGHFSRFLLNLTLDPWGVSRTASNRELWGCSVHDTGILAVGVTEEDALAADGATGMALLTR